MDIIRKIELVKTTDKDRPLIPVVIEDSGIIEVDTPFDVNTSDAVAWLRPTELGL